MTLPTAPSPESVALEDAAVSAIIDPLRAQLQAAARAITGLYVRLAGGIDDPIPLHLRDSFADGASRVIATVTPSIRDDLWQLVLDALRQGQLEAIQSAATDVQTTIEDQVVAARDRVHDWIAQVAGTAQERAQALLWSAQGQPLISPPRNYRDVITLLAYMYRALSTVERDVRWSVNAAHNQGSTQVAEQLDMSRMWVAERNACLHCLAYAGQIAAPGQPFAAGLTFYIGPDGQPKPLDWGPVWAPPRHPNCRCRIELVTGSEGYPIAPWEQSETTASDALKREARRSVLRGMSGSDSQPARLRAMSALLAVGSGLPKSVEARARAAVKAGKL